MSSHILSHISKEEENSLRMHLLLTRIAPKAVRVIFDREFPPHVLYASIRRVGGLIRLSRNPVITQVQWKLLYPCNGSPNSSNFDINLMVTLLRNLHPPVTAYHDDMLPRDGDCCCAADLARIKYYRNKLQLYTDGPIESAVFTIIWNDISGAIGRLGGQDLIMECEELRTKLLYHSTEQLSHIQDDKKKDTNFRIKIPEQITKMDEESINIYLKALETGSEQRRDINLVIVGKKGVGKTSLVRRLFGENIEDVKSTNGIEIHRRRCRISLNNWEWNKIPGRGTVQRTVSIIH